MRRLVIVLATLLVLVACGGTQSTSSSQLVLGAIYPLSGPQAEGGKQELAGVQAALKVAHANVRLQVIDATTPQAASAAVDTLVDTYHVPVILGTYGSTLSAAASARAEQLKTVYWETGAVADPITAQRKYVFRTVATGSSLGRMAVAFTHDVLIPRYGLASPRAVIVRVNDIYGRSVGGGEEQLAKTMGIDVVDVIEYNPNAYDANVITARLAADRADFLWDVSYLDDGVAIWKSVVQSGMTFKGAIGTSSAAGQALLAQAKAAYGGPMEIPAVAGFVGGWTLFHDVLPNASGTAESIRLAALKVDVPVGDSINGGGVKFAVAGALDQGQNTRSAAVVGQWQGVGVMRIVYPSAYAQ
jgi:branched-chain amino acid transport system substrate-binding protein